MAMTADQVIVQLIAQTQQYEQGMRSATQAAATFDARSTTALANLGNAFTGVGQGAVKMSADVRKALDNMARNQGPQRLSNQFAALPIIRCCWRPIARRVA